MIRCFVCGKWIIADLEPAIGYEGRVIHEKCRRRAILRDLGWIVILILTLCLVAQVCKAEVNDQKTWVKGGVVTGFANDGACVFKPFIKVDNMENDDEGRAQILGYSPGNVQIDRQGRVIFERVLERSFFPMHQAPRGYHGHLCRCPDWNNL